MLEQILSQLNLYVWAKDRHYRYLYCNENYAKAAGFDSPDQMIGKTDDQMPWRKLADFFRAGDYGVYQGISRINVPEATDTINNIRDILVTENQLLTNDKKCIGVVGSFIDITGKQLVKKVGCYDSLTKRYYLGEDLNNEYLTKREVEIFKRLLLGYTARETGNALKLSPKTVEGYIDNIRYKLQAKTKGEIIATAIQYGLTQILYLQANDYSSS